MERSRASPRSGRGKGPTDAARPWGGVTRKGEPSGPGYAGHILCMCRRPLCPFLCCMKFLLIQRLMCPVCRFSGFTGGEMNFHKCGWNCRVFCGNNSTLWISPPFSRLTSRVNFHIAWSKATHGGKLCGGGSGTSVLAWSFPSLSSFRPVGAPLRGITGRRPRSGRLEQNRKDPGTAYHPRIFFQRP